MAASSAPHPTATPDDTALWTILEHTMAETGERVDALVGLRQVDLHNTGMSDAGIAILRQALPGLTVLRR